MALVPLFILSAVKGGYFPQEWYPAALFLVALLLVGLLALPSGGRPPGLVLIAVGALTAFTAWNYLTIAWADQRADAWDGSNRTALYAVVFALFALWRIRARAAVALVGAFALGVAVIGAVELLSVMWTGSPARHFIGGRLAEPVEYPNGNAALWSSAFWPCLVLGSRRETGPLLRALFVGAAVLLGGLALMGQSRGWLFALPIVALLFLLLTPQRVRTTLTLALVLGAVGVCVPAILDVYDTSGPPLAGAADDAGTAILGAAAVAAALAGMGAFADRAQRRSVRVDRIAGRVLGALAALALVAGTLVYVAERGSPFTDVADAWDEFKTTGTPGGGGNRLVGRLGSNRYDFWKVAWNEFEGAPLGGIGSDNFQKAYLERGESGEQPRYPHSVELRTLSQTGLVGTALLVVAIGAALLAALRALRLRSGPARAAAAGGVGVFVYWFVHGSVDWFWEMPALGMAAFAMLGLAAGLAPRRPALRPAARRRSLAGSYGGMAATVAAVVIAVSLVGPWLSALYVDDAADVWTVDSRLAFDKLDRARGLNPLSPTPDVIAGHIALRLDRLDEAESRFRAAIEREPVDTRPHLQLGALLANDEGRREEGLEHLRVARRLDPRDEIIRRTMARARRGRQIDIEAMNVAIATRYRELGD